MSFQQVRKGVELAEEKADKDLENVNANVGPPTAVSSGNSRGIKIDKEATGRWMSKFMLWLKRMAVESVSQD